MLLPYAPVLADRTLAHQVRFAVACHGSQLTVGCNCQPVIAAKPYWKSGEGLATWRAFHEQHPAPGELPGGTAV